MKFWNQNNDSVLKWRNKYRFVVYFLFLNERNTNFTNDNVCYIVGMYKWMNIFNFWIRLLCVVFIVCAFGVKEDTIDHSEMKQVLFVSSYHSKQSWGRKVLDGVKAQLDTFSCGVDLRMIYLDSKRMMNSEVQKALLEAQLREMQDQLDLIIVSDKEANDALFALDSLLLKKLPSFFVV